MTAKSLKPCAIATLAALVFTAPLFADGAQPSCHGHAAPPVEVTAEAAPDAAETAAAADVAQAAPAGELTIPDVTLRDQDGREVRFYTDLVKDRVVAMNFVFTTCTTVCPPMGANFAKLQQLLAEQPGLEVEMISVSVDPAVDTPQRLKAWGERFGRTDGWTLLTGAKPEVDRLLKALKVFTPTKEDHSPIVLLGNDARHAWTRAYGLAPPATFAELLAEMSGRPAVAAAAP